MQAKEMDMANRKAELPVLERVRASLNAVARAADPKAVHFFRTSCRRLEAYAELAEGEGARTLRKLGKRLERARKLAGRVRDLDVQLELLRELETEREREERRVLLGDMEEARARAARKLARELDAETVTALRARIARARRAERSAPSNGASARGRAWESAVERLTRLADEFPKVKVKDLHELRLACKAIRYTAEQALPRAEARELIERMKQVQDAIGLWHDWLVLHERASEVLPGDSRLTNILRSHERTARAAALKESRAVVRPHIRVEAPPGLPTSAKRPEPVASGKSDVASAS
jgi:CHAD domain-containing protein